MPGCPKTSSKFDWWRLKPIDPCVNTSSPHTMPCISWYTRRKKVRWLWVIITTLILSDDDGGIGFPVETRKTSPTPTFDRFFFDFGAHDRWCQTTIHGTHSPNTSMAPSKYVSHLICVILTASIAQSAKFHRQHKSQDHKSPPASSPFCNVTTVIHAFISQVRRLWVIKANPTTHFHFSTGFSFIFDVLFATAGCTHHNLMHPPRIKRFIHCIDSVCFLYSITAIWLITTSMLFRFTYQIIWSHSCCTLHFVCLELRSWKSTSNLIIMTSLTVIAHGHSPSSLHILRLMILP